MPTNEDAAREIVAVLAPLNPKLRAEALRLAQEILDGNQKLGAIVRKQTDK